MAAIVLISPGRAAGRAAPAPVLEPLRSFDVVSVKVNPSRIRARRWRGSRAALRHGPADFQPGVDRLPGPELRIEGLPDWARPRFFDVNARAGREREIEERPAYYRALLVDRFNYPHIERARNGCLHADARAATARLDPACAAPTSTAMRRSRRIASATWPANGRRRRRQACGRPAARSVASPSLTGGAVELTIL